ncbi:MAG: FkbM family methyltransferase [Nitrosopumilus sp.]|nr:FkbM family methyltransferase [Nitrosopumilus sp.]MDA7942582.1 FkbM family methyltransferase [Nitrosopumilus sp.]
MEREGTSKAEFLRRARRVAENWHDLALAYAGLKRGPFVIRLRNGTRIRIRNNGNDIQVFATVWLLDDYGRDGFVPDGGTVVDVGAHIGMYSLYAAAVSDARILCYEPVAANHALLEENIRLNSVDARAFRRAVCGEEGPGRIFLSPDVPEGHSIHVRSGPGEEEILCTTIDRIIEENGLREVSVLKLDCEGSEYDILERASDSALSRIRRICMEYHIFDDRCPARLEGARRRLRDAGFELEDGPRDPGRGMLFAARL